MIASLRSIVLASALLVTSAFAYEPPQPSHPVEIVRYEWKDAKRDRVVPVKIYYPKDLSSPSPVIVFSHGLGGTRETYQYLGTHWAGCGYVSVHLQHPGSDDAVWKKAPAEGTRMASMREAMKDPANALNRPRDVSFAIDELSRLNRDPKSPLYGRLDMEHLGMAGHSFGAFTTMAAVGQRIGPAGMGMADPRIKAAIAMSSPVPVNEAIRAHAYDAIQVPVFHMTGTKDEGIVSGEMHAENRRVPFDSTKNGHAALVVFKDGDHMIFSGAPRLQSKGREKDETFHRHICAASVAWWDAHLRGNKDADAWLMKGGFAKELGTDGTFETK